MYPRSFSGVSFVLSFNSYLSTAPSNTCAPSSQSSGLQYSVGQWLIPNFVGVKIIPAGDLLCTAQLSCPAPLVMSIQSCFPPLVVVSERVASAACLMAETTPFANVVARLMVRVVNLTLTFRPSSLAISSNLARVSKNCLLRFILDGCRMSSVNLTV